jgi:hypothetical protein
MKVSGPTLSLALFVGALLIGTTALAAQHQSEEGKGEPSGTVEIDEKEFRLILGGEKGTGILRFQGKEYPFKVGGITVGGVGYTELKATGNVYKLEDVSQFPGIFSQFTAGVTVGKGMGGITLINENDVRMDLKTSSEGVALDIGAGGMKVTMEE